MKTKKKPKNNKLEEKITGTLIKALENEKDFKLMEPGETEYKAYKYDLLLKNNKNEVIALIEAKYRNNSCNPTTEVIIVSLIKLFYEWCFTYKRDENIKLVILIYLIKGVNEVKCHFRNNVLGRIAELFKAFGCNIDIPRVGYLNVYPMLEIKAKKVISVDNVIKKIKEYFQL